MWVVRWLIVAACLVGCYSPKFGDCETACGPNSSCPPGLTCDNAVCRLPEMVGTACAEPADANTTVDINPENCTWALVSTNFAPADVPDTAPPPWDVGTDETFMTGDVDGHAVSQSGASALWIVHKSRFTVAAGATLTIEGNHPLVIAADDIDIAGTIIVKNGTGDASCDADVGADSCDAAGGGGGGGYGDVGGDGGGGAGDQGGAASGITPAPLRSGCSGAKGGDGKKTATDFIAGGAGGAGGGALQLSGRKTLRITGTIAANGFAGLQGRSDPAGTFACGTYGRASGGGGGGGGGTILVESCAVVIEPTAKLCANGASGGGGAGGGNTNMGVAGNDGTCEMQAIGGAGEVAGAQGGNGGFDGLPATAGAKAARGGGGGGGAVGRIHIFQVSGAPVTAGATIRPPANRSQ
jgi:hypothetical protein